MNADRRKRISAVNTQEIRDAVEKLKGMIESAREEYTSIMDEEQEYYDNMPENMQTGDRGTAAEDAIETLGNVIGALEDLDTFDNIVTALDDVDGASF